MPVKKFSFTAKLVRYQGPGGWHFLAVPLKMSQQIKASYPENKKVGWSYVKIKATIGKTSWPTTLFPTKEGPFLLAVKAAVRQKEELADGDMMKASCTLL